MPPTARRSRPQPAPTIADRLDAIVPMIDALVRDARLGHPLSVRAYEDLEARAQGIANVLVATFRGEVRTPVAKPLWQRDGQALF